MSPWDYGEIFWKAELVFSLEAENNDNTAPNHNQTHNHKYIKWSDLPPPHFIILYSTLLITF